MHNRMLCCNVQVLMVAPTAFGFNEQTAADNTFMHSSGKTGSTSNVAVHEAILPSVENHQTCLQLRSLLHNDVVLH
jgi:hypothetical protein